MLPLIRAEFRKSGKRYSRAFKLTLALITLLALLVSYISFGYGFNSDSGLFTSASDVYVVDYRLFHHLMLDRETVVGMLKAGKVDVFLTGRYIVVSDTVKSHAAGEEMKNYIRGEFERWIYEKYGIYAFPVMVRAEYLKRSVQPTLTPEPVSVEKIREISEQVNRESRKTADSDVEKEIEKAVSGSDGSGSGEGLVIPKRAEGGYSTPDEFSPPSLVSKMVLAFLFIVPPFFVMQVFSSSLAEDVRMKRLEVLLSTPIRPESIVFQKLAPYFLVAVALTAIPSMIFGVNGVAYMLAPLLLLFSAQAFMAVNSRSYRELTFLILVINLLVIVYLVLPSVFSGLPLSDISPVTFLLRSLSGESVSPSDVILSSLPLATVALLMLYLTSRSLNIEILYSTTSPFERFIRVLGESAKSDARAFLLSMASVFLALFLEFFLLFFGLSVPIVTSYAVIMLGVAIIEESLKSALIMPSKTASRAVAVAAGFFMAEKTLLIVNIFRDYSIVLPGELFIFPLLLHTASSLTFAIVARRDWRAGFVLAVLIHFTYNYGTVIML
ncbi:hypothetical protein [Geoglobus sp.]